MGSHAAKVGFLPTPQILVTGRTATTVSLSWSLPRSYSKVSQYVVERGTDGTSFPNTVYSGLGLSTTDNVPAVSGQSLYYRVRYTTTDGKTSAYSKSASKTVYAPVISSSADTSITIPNTGGTYQWAPWVSDADVGDTILYSIISSFHPNITINSLTGVMTVPSYIAGQSGNVTIMVTDAYGLTDTHTCSVTVEEATGIPASIFVRDNGSDTTGNGSESSPYATLNKAISVATSGAIIELQKSGGGVWQTGQTISFNRNFSTTNPVTIRVRAGDTIRFWPSSTVTRILQTTASGYVFDGSAGSIEVGNQALWTTAGGGTDTYPQTYGIGAGSIAAAAGLQYLTLKGLKISGNASGWGGLQFEQAGDGIVLDDCDLYGHGTVPDSRDGIFMVGCGWAKVENSKFRFFGGHGYIGMTATRGPFAVRNNEIDGGWLPATGEAYRIGEFAPSQGYPNQSLPASTEPAIVENNLIYGVGLSPTDPTGNPTMKLNGRRLIFRFNYLLRCHSDKAEYNTAYLANTEGCIKHMRLYHNTFYDHWNMFTTDGNSKLVNDLMGDIRRVNNIYASITSKPHAEWGGVTLYTAVYRRVAAYGNQGYENGWMGLRMDGNMINVLNSTRIELQSTADGGGVATSLAQAQSLWPTVWLPTNNTNVPVFVNPSLDDRAGFELALGSPGRGQAVPMATVSSASSGTTVTLSDAYWIYDGTWIPGDVGDYIAFYNSSGTVLKGIRQVLSVNTQTSATLTQPISVSSGDQVYLVLSDGQTVCRNVGASQV